MKGPHVPVSSVKVTNSLACIIIKVIQGPTKMIKMKYANLVFIFASNMPSSSLFMSLTSAS